MSENTEKASNFFVTIIIFALILAANYALYNFIIVPFGTIYKISSAIQISIIIPIALITVFMYIRMVIKQRGSSGVKDFDYGVGLKRKSETKINVMREVSALFGDLDHQLSTENVGALDNLYMQLLELAGKAHPSKRAGILDKLATYKFEIDRLKEKYNS